MGKDLQNKAYVSFEEQYEALMLADKLWIPRHTPGIELLTLEQLPTKFKSWGRITIKYLTDHPERCALQAYRNLDWNVIECCSLTRQESESLQKIVYDLWHEYHQQVKLF